MAKVRIMYWKEVPVQVQASDENGTVSVPLDDRFQEAADALAMMDGSAGTDQYLMAWEWGEYVCKSGSAADLSSQTADRINSGMPHDFVARIRDLENNGNRNPKPGAIDTWIKD
ncbi:MAG TPA: hypothetical protein EYP00_02365 [Dehalococcoidia bacterium]|nr:hypothetical protein [Dehalococcoidia bacterium]